MSHSILIAGGGIGGLTAGIALRRAGRVRRERLGSHAPALTVIVARTLDPRWLLEIEAMAAARQE